MSLSGLGEVADLVKDVSDKIWPDATQREENMAALEAQIATAQAAIDEQEAASNNLFVAGWRPFIGWVCGIAFAYHMILVPIANYYYALEGVKYTMPVFDTSMLSTTLMGMLGLGVMRTVEKMGDKSHLPWQQ